MSTIDRRTFLGKTAATLGAAMAGQVMASPAGELLQTTTRPAKRLGSDTVTLAGTGLKPSRLAMGTGTSAGAEQRNLGISGLARLLRHAYDQGVRWWDVADMYKTHPHVQAALKELPRDRVIITTKTLAKDHDGVKADVERFRREMNIDQIDIVLLHCLTDPEWPDKMKGAMDALSEAKSKGHVRAVGCSCHTFGALEAAAKSPWVEVDLARINPFAEKMDVDKREEIQKVVATLESMHAQGKAVYGMKILGEGKFKGDQIDESLRFALSRSFLSGFVIGFGNQDQFDDIARRIERLSVAG